MLVRPQSFKCTCQTSWHNSVSSSLGDKDVRTEAIKIGASDNLLPTPQAVREAVAAGSRWSSPCFHTLRTESRKDVAQKGPKFSALFRKNFSKPSDGVAAIDEYDFTAVTAETL